FLFSNGSVTGFKKMSGKPKYKTDEERIVARSASRKKYRQSEKGRKTKLEGMDRYLSTEYGNKKARDWRQSENGKKLRDEAYDRYIQTEYGKEERRLTHLNFMKGINARIAHNCRARVGRALKGLSKSNKTLDLIGCSIQELHERLERQFKYGMTWENYGEWHI